MKTEFKKLKTGEKLSETQYYTVVKISGSKVQLKNGLGQDIVVDSKYVDDCLVSGEQFTEEKKITKTEAAQLFLANPNVAFTVSFNKQVKETDVAKEILEAYKGSTPSTMETAIKKAVKKGLNGEERVLVGYHTGVQDEFGRVSAVDMSITEGHPLRLVDPREINYLVLKGTKYTVK